MATPVFDGASESVVRDANGNMLVDGDSVVIIKDLKVKGSSVTLKVGTRLRPLQVFLPAKNICVREASDSVRRPLIHYRPISAS